MIYNGMELEEVTEPQVFDEPKVMLAWGSGHPTRRTIVAILPGGTAVDIDRNWLSHCAFIPEGPTQRRATNRELAKWLATGNGEYTNQIGSACSAYTYDEKESDNEVSSLFKVRKWEDTDWHAPTVDYLGLEDK